jgi:hypothetical protein
MNIYICLMTVVEDATKSRCGDEIKKLIGQFKYFHNKKMQNESEKVSGHHYHHNLIAKCQLQYSILNLKKDRNELIMIYLTKRYLISRIKIYL